MNNMQCVKSLGKWLLIEFKNYRDGNANSEQKIREVWEYGFQQMLAGNSVSKLMINASIKELESVIQKYKEKVL